MVKTTATSRTWFGYAVAGAATVGAVLLRFAVDPWLGDTAQFITFFAAIVLTGALGGRGPAFAATALSALAVTYFFIPPDGALAPMAPAHGAALALFVLTAAFIAWIAGRMHQAQRKASREAARSTGILESMGDGYIALDRNWTITAMNRAAERVLHMQCPQTLGRSLWDCFPQAVGSRFQREYERVLAENTPANFEEFFAPLDTWFDVSAYPTPEGLALFFRNITARKRAEQALQEQRERLRVTLASIGDAVLATDAEGQLTFLNPVAARLTGWPEAEALGQPVARVFQIINEQTRQPANDIVAQVLRERQVVALANHTALITRDGRELPIEDSAAPILDAAGNLSGAVLVFHDVAAKREAQQALARRERELRTLLEHLPVGAWLMDASGTIVYGNPAGQRIWRGAQYVPPERFGVYKGWWADSGKPLAAEEWAAARAIRLGQTRLDEIIEIECFDGTRKFIRNGAVPIRGEDGSILGAVILNEDITQQRADQEALKRAKAELEQRVAERTAELRAAHQALLAKSRHVEAFFQHALTPLVFLDRDFNFIRVNEAYAKACSRSVSDFPGQNHFKLFPHAENQAIFEAVVRNRTPHVALAKPFEFPDHPEWGVTYWDWTLVPMLDDAGEVEFLVFSLEDVTVRKRAEMELEQHSQQLEEMVRQRTADLEAARTAAEQANRAKDHFLAVLSHELRTPLTPALAAVGMLAADARLPQEVREDLAMVQRNIHLETRLIDDLLEVTHLANGKFVLRPERVDAAAILQAAARMIGSELHARQQVLTVEMPDAPPYLLMGDSTRLHQVFWNLIKNASKYTPRGGRMTVRCQRELLKGTPWLKVEVTDTGMGIDPEFLPMIFAPFAQGGRVLHDGMGGLGLGLAIARAIVEMHGGCISAHSQGRDQGATFTVELPLLQSEIIAPSSTESQGNPHPASRHEPAHAIKPLRILLVEDHPDTAKVMQRLLTASGHAVRVAEGVNSALAAAEAEAFDLLLSDLGLPDGSGVDLMRELRRRGVSVPGIAISGYGQEEDIRRSREAGFATHLTKPTSPDRLAEAIATVTNQGSAPT